MRQPLASIHGTFVAEATFILYCTPGAGSATNPDRPASTAIASTPVSRHASVCAAGTKMRRTPLAFTAGVLPPSQYRDGSGPAKPEEGKRQKAKGKRQKCRARRGVKTFAFCLLPFVFCLRPFTPLLP